MTIAVFGGTGKAGRVFVWEAARAGHRMKVLARNTLKAKKMLPEEIEIVHGAVEDIEKVKETVKDTDAIVSLIGHTKSSFPNVMTIGVTNIINAMYEMQVKRLIALTGAGVFVDKDQPRIVDKALIKVFSLIDPDRVKDGEKYVHLIKKSLLHWTVIRTQIQTNMSKKGIKYEGYLCQKTPISLIISRHDIALFILNCLENKKWIKEAPVII
jgi:putative NADH-flavin reductase